jgi:hypothetical protein
MRRVPLALAVSLAALAPLTARAQTSSPRWGSFELGTSSFAPNVDSAFAPIPGGPTGAGPWEQMFGIHRRWGLRVGLSKTVLDGFGALDVGLRTGYVRAGAKGFVNTAPDGQPAIWVRSGDTTYFHMIPTSAMVTYRLDWFAERFNVPLAPYGRFAFERYNWWVENGNGATKQKGATNGWSITGGVALLLDFFDPGLARELDAETGINHTYLFFDVTKTQVDDFGASKSWDLSERDVSYGAGLMFVF